MNFYNEDEKKEGAPVMPSAASPFKKTSAFGKAPMFSRAAGSIADRLKNLSRKDLAFVAIGLSVLVMAPVAEYMMSQPAQDNLLKETFNPRSGPGGLMDPGINGLSTGSPDGSGEVITPLSSRDPMSLILGAQPAQAAVAPPTAPSAPWRDAVKESGRNAFSEASKSAGAPTLIPRMQAAMRGLSFGGENSRTSGTLGGGKIIEDAQSASSKAKSRSMVGPVAMAGYKGVASNTPNSASKGAFEKLRAQADKSAGNFSGGSAMTSLDKAAADALDIGKGAGGMGAGGDSPKTERTSGSTNKNEHNNSGETLAEMMAKKRAEKELEWEFFKKYEIKKQLINAVVGAVSTTLGKFISASMETALGMDPPAAAKCWNPPACSNGDCADFAKDTWGPGWQKPGPNNHKLKELCLLDDPVAIKAVVGKESATSTSEVCLCGKGAGPTTGGSSPPAPGGGTSAPGGNPTPGESPSSTPPQHSAAAVANLKDYDSILRDMVVMVAETEADPKKAEANLKGVVGGFQNLYPKAKENITMLTGLRTAAETELGGFNAALAASQSKLSGIQPKYETFAAQLQVISDNCKSVEKCTLKMKTQAGTEAVLNEAARQKVLDMLKQWNDTGAVFYNVATGNLEGQRKWSGAFSSQLPPIVNGIAGIEKNQGAIDSSWAEIYREPGIGPVGKLKKLSGRLQDVEESTPTEKGANPPLQLTAVNQRGLDWETLWNGKTHEMNATKVAEAEASEFNAWKSAVGKAANSSSIAVTPTVTTNFVSSQMRSTQLKSTIKGQLPGFAEINRNLDNTVIAMDTVKSGMLGYGVDPSYFGGATPPTPPSPVPPTPPSPVPPTPPSPVPPTPPSPVPPKVSLSPADAGAISGAINSANANLDTYSSTRNSIQKLPAAVKPGAYSTAKKTAESKLVALNTAKADVEKAKANLVKLPATATRAEATSAIRNMDQANEAFRGANTDARTAYNAASAIAPKPPLHPVSPVSPVPSTAALDGKCESMRFNFRGSLSSENSGVQLAIDAANKSITASKLAYKAYSDCFAAHFNSNLGCGAKSNAADAAQLAMADRMRTLKVARDQCARSLSNMRGQLAATKCTGNNDIGYCK